MLRHYKLFYTYVLIFATCYWLKLTSRPLIDNFTYSRIYFWTGVVQGCMAAFVLLQIFRLGGRAASKLRWAGIAAFPIMIFAVTSTETSAHWYVRTINGLYALLTALALANLDRLKPLILGNNYYGILGGILIPNGLVTLNYMAYLSRFSWWPIDLFRHLGEPIVWIAWLVILAGMWRYSPPRRLDQFLRETRLGEGEARVC